MLNQPAYNIIIITHNNPHTLQLTKVSQVFSYIFWFFFEDLFIGFYFEVHLFFTKFGK